MSAAPLDPAALDSLARRPPVARLLAVLDGAGEETRIVGGAVRNALIGRPLADMDLATTALPEETTRRARAAGLKTVPTGMEHGTVTVLVEGEPFEVTTLREDIETDGRRAVVRFGRDFRADALRRDFTINALSLGRDGMVHDYAGGLEDLAARRVRFIGEASARIREDYLRILRFFRFHAEYGEGPLDPDGLAASIGGREGLVRLSRERVRVELLKLAAARRGPEIAAALEQAGLLGRLVSCLGDAGRLARSAGCDPAGRLAAYLVRSGGDADRLFESLRLSKAEHARLSGYAGALAFLVSRRIAIGEADLRRSVVLHGLAATGLVLRATAGEPRPLLTEGARRLLAAFESGERPLPVFPLTGGDLVAAGMAPGPEIGRRLAEWRAAWIAAGCPEGWTAGPGRDPPAPPAPRPA